MHRSINILDTTAGTTTTEPVSIEGARVVSVWATATIATGNTGLIRVQTSADGSYWADYNKLIDNVTNTNSQQLTRISAISFAASSNGVKFASLSPEDTFRYLRITAGGNAHIIVYVEIEDEQHI